MTIGGLIDGGLGVGVGIGEGLGVGVGAGVGVGVGVGLGVATLTSAGSDRTPRPNATISAVPELSAFAVPVELIVTTASLSETQVNITSLNSLFPASKAFAVNRSCDPCRRLVAGGETETRITAGDGPNGAPETVVPGLNGCMFDAI